jgi:hypothetical protein
VSEPGYELEDFGEYEYGPEVEVGPVEMAALEVELDEAQRVDPGAYEPLQDLTLEAGEYLGEAQWEARQQLAKEGYEQGLVDQVASVAGEYGISSPEAIREVAAQVDQAKRELFTRYLAQGYDVAQAGNALDDADLDGAIRQGLDAFRYEAATNTDASLRQWRQGRSAQAEKDGRALASDEVIFGPSWQKLNAVTSAHAARQRQRDAVWQQHFRNRNKGYR